MIAAIVLLITFAVLYRFVIKAVGDMNETDRRDAVKRMQDINTFGL